MSASSFFCLSFCLGRFCGKRFFFDVVMKRFLIELLLFGLFFPPLLSREKREKNTRARIRIAREEEEEEEEEEEDARGFFSSTDNNNNNNNNKDDDDDDDAEKKKKSVFASFLRRRSRLFVFDANEVVVSRRRCKNETSLAVRDGFWGDFNLRNHV